jgi:hypothetical protein
MTAVIEAVGGVRRNVLGEPLDICSIQPRQGFIATAVAAHRQEAKREDDLHRTCHPRAIASPISVRQNALNQLLKHNISYRAKAGSSDLLTCKGVGPCVRDQSRRS